MTRQTREQADSRLVSTDRENQSGLKVGGVDNLSRGGKGGMLDNLHRPHRATGVPKCDALAGTAPSQPRRIHRNGRELGARRYPGRDESADRRRDRDAPQVSHGTQSHDPWPFFDRAGPKLRPGEIDGDPTLDPNLGGRATDVVRHPSPCLRAIVGAVDPGDVHSTRHETTDQCTVVGRLGGQRHHDPGDAPSWTRAEETVGIGVERSPSTREVEDVGVKHGALSAKRRHRGVDRRQNMRFAASERGQSSTS